MLSILGGRWKGRRLKVPRSAGVRPSAVRIKKSIFDIIEAHFLKQTGDRSLAGPRVLDLYAGAGALGLEALSRGAETCVLVEKSRRHAQVIAENIETLKAGEVCELIVADAAAPAAGWGPRAPYSLVLMDPPYRDSQLQQVLDSFAEGAFLADQALIVVEHDPRVTLTVPSGLAEHSRRETGAAGITVFTFSKHV